MTDLTTSAQGQTTLEPKGQSGARLKALDLIRGVAILGILPVNMAFFSGPALDPDPTSEAWYDRLAAVVVMFLFEGKMVTLLSLLFGAGIALQADHAQAAGRRFAPYYGRRMLVLFFIGLAHALLLSHIDILTFYAVAGFMALLFVRRSERWLLRIAGALLAWCYGTLLVVTLFVILGGALETQNADTQPAEPTAAEQSAGSSEDAEGQIVTYLENLFTRENEIRIFRHGSFGELVVHRAIYLGIGVVFFWLEMAWYLLACILIGAWLLRRSVFHEPESQRQRFRKWIGFGLSWGLLCHAAAVVAYLRSPDGWLYFCLLAFGALPLALAYLCILVLWTQTERFVWLQNQLRAVGRLALSNYLLQSVVCGLVFSGYGLGLYGQLNTVATMGIVAVLWAIQIFLSRFWLKHFQVGPAEWLWRSLTEGRRYTARQTA